MLITESNVPDSSVPRLDIPCSDGTPKYYRLNLEDHLRSGLDVELRSLASDVEKASGIPSVLVVDRTSYGPAAGTAAALRMRLSSVTVSEAIAWVRTTVPFAKPNLGIVHTLLQWEAEASVHVPGYLPSLSLHQYMDTTPERLAQLLNPSLGSDLACGLCTFINVKSATKCEMCDSTSRG